MSAPYVLVGRVADIPPLGGRCVKTERGPIGVFRTADDRIFAIDNRCPHRGGPLSEGIVHGTAVTCPLHNAVISLETGEIAGPDEGRVETIAVRVVDGEIHLALPERMERHPVPLQESGADLRRQRGDSPRRSRRAAGHPQHRDAARGTQGERVMDAAASPATRTTCPYCGVGCGVLARPDGGGGVSVSGDPSHPANFGRLCSKGSTLGETVGLENRLLHPMAGGRRVSWDAALTRVADAFSAAIAEHGPDSVALYVSGQLLTEDYYVANKLMKGFIGSANIDTNSRLCMASSVAGHKRAFGADTVPGVYEDLEAADLIVLVGSNLAWCHPVLHQRIAAAKALRPSMRIVAIDPRQTATTSAADLHLPIAPDTDVALFAGLLAFLARSGLTDTAYVADHTAGAGDALAEAGRWTLDAVAAATGLPAAAVADFYSAFGRTERVVTIYSQGVNQSAHGTDKVNAIINAHLLTGRIGRPGMGPFSVTGQPNAMGGREVGGLSNALACHMELENPAHRAIVQRHWGAPVMADRPGLKAVELFEAVHEGRIKALWVMATNPSASLPDADRVDSALANVPFLAVSDVAASTDTLRHADVALPAAAWGEKSGTVTNSERRISRQRQFLPLPGEARPDWDIVCDVARRMGFSGFDYDGPHAIFDEFAALSAADNDGRRDFDIGGLAGLGRAGYDRLEPQQWPVPAAGRGPVRFFANGGFFTPDRRARLVPTPFVEPPKTAPRFPFVLNTGRVRDQWHTMTRTGLAPTLSSHLAEPFAEIHPDDAAALGISPATLVTVASPRGERHGPRSRDRAPAARQRVRADPLDGRDERQRAGRQPRRAADGPGLRPARIEILPRCRAPFPGRLLRLRSNAGGRDPSVRLLGARAPRARPRGGVCRARSPRRRHGASERAARPRRSVRRDRRCARHHSFRGVRRRPPRGRVLHGAPACRRVARVRGAASGEGVLAHGDPRRPAGGGSARPRPHHLLVLQCRSEPDPRRRARRRRVGRRSRREAVGGHQLWVVPGRDRRDPPEHAATSERDRTC